MSWPFTTAKHPSKKPCSFCKSTFEAGAKIYKINEEYWCSNPTCPKLKEGPARQEPFNKEENTSPAIIPSLDTKTKQFHTEAFQFALDEATRFYGIELDKISKENHDIQLQAYLKERMILAQVLYKGIVKING